MALEGRVELAQRDYFVKWTKPRESQRNVQCGRLVSGGPDDAVAIRPVGVVRIVIGGMEVEGGSYIHNGERAAGVARACRAQRDKIVTAHQVGCLAKFFDGIIAVDISRYRIHEGHVLLLGESIEMM